jgi:hypothetical protein
VVALSHVHPDVAFGPFAIDRDTNFTVSPPLCEDVRDGQQKSPAYAGR